MNETKSVDVNEPVVVVDPKVVTTETSGAVTMEETNLPSWWQRAFFSRFLNAPKGRKVPKRETGYYVVVNGETKAEYDKEGKMTKKPKKFSEKVDRFKYPLPTKILKKKYQFPHISPEKYRAHIIEEEKVKVQREDAQRKAEEKAAMEKATAENAEAKVAEKKVVDKTQNI